MCFLETSTTELFLEKAQTYHHELCFNFTDHCWNQTDVLEMKIFVFQYLHPSVFLNAHLFLFIHTTEQFFKISLSALRNLSKQAEDTPSFILVSFMPMNAQ